MNCFSLAVYLTVESQAVQMLGRERQQCAPDVDSEAGMIATLLLL